MFGYANMKEYVNSEDAESQFSLWEQTGNSKQLIDLKVQDERRRVGIALKQIVAEEKEGCRGCKRTVHKQVLFLIQRRFECQDFILSWKLKFWMNKLVIFYVDMEVFEPSSITELFVADGKYEVERLFILVANKKQSSFKIERMLLKSLDKWMLKIPKMISPIQGRRKYIRLKLNFIEVMARQQQIWEQQFILFEKLFMQDINIQTLCRRDDYDSRAKGHSKHRIWHLGEREKAANAFTFERG